MGKCGILWEKMRIVSKEKDLAMYLCELCCCTFLFYGLVRGNFAISTLFGYG